MSKRLPKLGVHSLLFAVAWSLLSCQGTAKETNKEEAQTLAHRAAVAGMLGNSDQRKDFTHSALETDPNNALANAQAGRVAHNKAWITIGDYEQEMRKDNLLAEYGKRRDAVLAGKAADLDLANWCRKHHLSGREQLHLGRVWRNPSIPLQQRLVVGKRLGMKNIGGVWMSPAEIKGLRDSVKQHQSNDRRWRPATTKLIGAIEFGNADRRKVAIARYQQSLESSAVVNIENQLSPRSEVYALLAIKFIAAIPEHEATESLVRHSVFSKWEKVRDQAIQALAKRDKNEVLPLLMSNLSNPLEAKFAIGVGADGLVRSAQQVTERGREANIRHVNANARGIHNVNQVGVRANRRGTQGRVVMNADDFRVRQHLEIANYDTYEERLAAEADLRRMFAMQRQFLVRQEAMRAAGIANSVQVRNRQTSQSNERAIAALESITGETLEPAEADAWWEWWNITNEREETEKETYTSYIVKSDPVQYSVSRGCECFPAGTPVRCQTGMQSIELIKPGDRVLSRDTDSGRLAYRLVVDTTVRPPSSMKTIQFEGGEVDATSGHLFWVEEHGWKMAKNLRPQDRIHALSESRQVTSVKNREEGEAFNLIVADFGTYYVGEQGILVHDNSERRRTKAVSPGVLRQR